MAALQHAARAVELGEHRSAVVAACEFAVNVDCGGEDECADFIFGHGTIFLQSRGEVGCWCRVRLWAEFPAETRRR